jgi:hypothetical protein
LQRIGGLPSPRHLCRVLLTSRSLPSHSPRLFALLHSVPVLLGEFFAQLLVVGFALRSAQVRSTATRASERLVALSSARPASIPQREAAARVTQFSPSLGTSLCLTRRRDRQ